MVRKVHPRRTREKTRDRPVLFAAYFAVIFAIGAVCVVTLRDWGLTLMLVESPILFFGAAAFALTRAPKRRILLLRRFHSEGSKFPASRIFDSLTWKGYDCVTLSDSIVSYDRMTGAAPFALVSVAVVMTIIALPVYLICRFLASLQLSAPPLWAVPIGMLVVILIPLWLILACSRPLGASLQNFFGSRLVKAKQIQRLWRRSAIRRPWQQGLSVLRTADADWKDAVRHLVRRCDIVCFDFSQPSKNMRTELEIILEEACDGKLLWLVEAKDDFTRLSRDQAYIVSGFQFRGTPRTFRLPQVEASLLSDNKLAYVQASQAANMLDKMLRG